MNSVETRKLPPGADVITSMVVRNLTKPVLDNPQKLLPSGIRQPEDNPSAELTKPLQPHRVVNTQLRGTRLSEYHDARLFQKGVYHGPIIVNDEYGRVPGNRTQRLAKARKLQRVYQDQGKSKIEARRQARIDVGLQPINRSLQYNRRAIQRQIESVHTPDATETQRSVNSLELSTAVEEMVVNQVGPEVNEYLNSLKTPQEQAMAAAFLSMIFTIGAAKLDSDAQIDLIEKYQQRQAELARSQTGNGARIPPATIAGLVLTAGLIMYLAGCMSESRTQGATDTLSTTPAISERQEAQGGQSIQNTLGIAPTEIASVSATETPDNLELETNPTPETTLPFTPTPALTITEPTALLEPTPIPEISFTLEQQQLYDEIQDIYHTQGVQFPFSKKDLFDFALTSGETVYDPGVISVEVPSGHVNTMLYTLQILNELLGHNASRYVNSLKYFTNAPFGGQFAQFYDEDGKLIKQINIGYNNMDQARLVGIHEAIHAIDLGQNVHDLTTSLKIQLIKAKLTLELHDPHSTWWKIYSDRYNTFDYSPYVAVGNYAQQNKSSLFIDSKNQEQQEEILSYIAGLEQDGNFTGTDPVYVGWKIMELKRMNPELTFSREFEQEIGFMLYRLSTEVFAEVTENILRGSGFYRDQASLELIQQILNLARQDFVTLEELEYKLRYDFYAGQLTPALHQLTITE